MEAHPKSQPHLTIIIVIVLALIFGTYMRSLTKKNRLNIERDTVNKRNEKFKFAFGFWIGGGVYSLINLIMNANKDIQRDILFYNYLITCVAVLALIGNFIFWKKRRK